MRRRSIGLGLLVAAIAACSGGTPPSAPAASPGVRADTSPTSPSPSAALPTSAATATNAPAKATTPTTSPAGTNAFAAGDVAKTAVDRLRVRSLPSVSDDSIKYEPLLPLETPLYVLGGPVSAAGYAWYEVAPLTSRPLPAGWVAASARDGGAWLEDGQFDCPPRPVDLRALAALGPAVGLACFARVPITVEAGLVSCNCDADGASYTPEWFFLGSGGPALLVEPDKVAAGAPADPGEWFALNLDPAGEHPDRLPLGQIVEVTGVFDHPAAASCMRTEMDRAPVRSHGCRMEFAVTRLLVRGP